MSADKTDKTEKKKVNLTLSTQALQEAEAGKLKDSSCEMIFSKYDHNHDGSVDVAELRAICMEMGVFLSEEELRIAIHIMDTDGNGKIEFEEFKRWWSTSDRFDRLRHNDQELAFLNGAFASFLSFDRDMDGTVSKEEFVALHKVLHDCGYRTRNFEDDWAFMDLDRSGYISFNEYVDWLIFQAQAPVDPSPEASAPPAEEASAPPAETVEKPAEPEKKEEKK